MRIEQPAAVTRYIGGFALWMESKSLCSHRCDTKEQWVVMLTVASPIYSKVDAMPRQITVSMGMMPVIPTPQAEGFAAHKHTWFKSPDRVKSYKALRTGELMDE